MRGIRRALALVFGAGIVATAVAAPHQNARVPTALMESRCRFAESAYRAYSRDNRDVEKIYKWSRRWMEGTCALKPGLRDKVRAIEAHLERMRRLETVTEARYKMPGGTADVGDLPATQYYAAEAEIWLREAKAKGE
jgi:hypothetical protein